MSGDRRDHWRPSLRILAERMWATPRTAQASMHGEAPGYDRSKHTGAPALATQAMQWATPRSSPNENRGCSMPPSQADGRHGQALASQASTWATPIQRDWKDGDCSDATTPTNGYLGRQAVRWPADGWPTPSAQVVNDGESPETWVARAEKLREKGYNANGAGLPLAVAVKVWPTPVQRDAHNAHRSTTTAEAMHPGTMLVDAMMQFDAAFYGISPSLPPPTTPKDGAPTSHGSRSRHRPSRVLNPQFVEALMGWPLLWSLPFPISSRPASTASACSETASSPTRPPSPSSTSIDSSWPTPRVEAIRTSRKALVQNPQWSAPAMEQVVELAMGVLPREFASEEELTPAARRTYEERALAKAWPTPQAHDAMSPKTPEQIVAARERAAPRETGGKPGFRNLNEVAMTWGEPMDTESKWNVEKLPSTYEERKEYEFFTTDPALAARVCQRIAVVVRPPQCILEPSAGDGSFVRAAKMMWPVAGTEIIAVEPLMAARKLLQLAGADEVASVTLEQFVNVAPERVQRADLILGNPPFTVAEQHIRLLMQLMKPGAHIAFLLRLGFYGAGDRQAFWEEFPEKWMFPVNPRPSFLGEHGKGKTDGQEYGVFVWEKCEREEDQRSIHSRRGPLIVWEKAPRVKAEVPANGTDKPKRKGRKNGAPIPADPTPEQTLPLLTMDEVGALARESKLPATEVIPDLE